MGMQDKPDVFGLPIYQPSKFYKERVGDKIRIVCGVEAFGQINWTHVTILDVTDMALLTAESEAMEDNTLANFKLNMKLAVGH